MRKKIVNHENVIQVDFSNHEQDGGDGDYPKKLVVELGKKAYTAAQAEEDLTGLNKSTITSRALQAYHYIIEKQREGLVIGFFDEQAGELECVIIDDPWQNNATE